jgi:hypothetical protein
MNTFSYPSPDFPALPMIELTTPDDWTAVPSAGAAIAVRAADGPNVVITVHRHLAGFSLEQTLADLRSELGQYDQSQVDDPFPANFGDDPYVVINTALTHPTYGQLVQVHAYTSFLLGPLKDVVQVVGTCAGHEVARDYPRLQQVMESTRARPATLVAAAQSA